MIVVRDWPAQRAARAVGRLGAAVALFAAACAGASCGGNSALAQSTSAKNIKTLPADLLPADVLGLAVAQENMSETLSTAKRSYVDKVGVYSFRRDELLQATLQVSRFNQNADAGSAKFRSALLAQIGGSLPKQVRVGADTVYVTRGTKQSLSVWFRGRTMLVLAVREDFDEPRTLLREVLKLKVDK